MRELKPVALDNLALWQRAALENTELRLLQATRLGEALGSEQTLDREELRLEPIEQGALAAHLTAQEQVALCRGLLRSCPDLFAERQSTPASPPAAPKVAFLDSTFGREALRRFRRVLPHPRPITATSFTEVCELLMGDGAEFAILPIEDSLEGKFLHLYEEIDRYELHITHTCDIPYPGEGRSVTMALIGKRYLPDATQGKRLLCCRTLAQDGGELTELLCAAELMGLTLHRVTHSPAPHGDSGVFYDLIFEFTPPARRLLELYLAIRHPRAGITGQYFHLEEE